MDSFGLMEFDKQGPKFSFSNKKNPPSLSKIDIFFANIEWFGFLPSLSEVSLGFFGLGSQSNFAKKRCTILMVGQNHLGFCHIGLKSGCS